MTNALRVKNRDLLEELIENETIKKTTQEWLEIFEGCGMPYAAINDIQGTLNHDHGMCPQIRSKFVEVDGLNAWQSLRETWLQRWSIQSAGRSNWSTLRSNTRSLSRKFARLPQRWVSTDVKKCR